MKSKKQINDNVKLHEFDIQFLQTQILNDILYQMTLPRGRRYRKSFEANFFTFVEAFSLEYLHGDRNWHDDLDDILSYPQPTDGFVLGYLAGGLERKDKQSAEILAQNALIYGIACACKFQIPPAYMRAKVELPGTQVANHTDQEYAAYVIETQSLLATFVKSKNKFWGDKILTVMGYIVNPDLEV